MATSQKKTRKKTAEAFNPLDSHNMAKEYFAALLWYATGNGMVEFSQPVGEATSTLTQPVDKLSNYASKFTAIASGSSTPNPASVVSMISKFEETVMTEYSDQTHRVHSLSTKSVVEASINYGVALQITGELFTKLSQGKYGTPEAYPPDDPSCTAGDIIGIIPTTGALVLESSAHEKATTRTK